MTTIIKKIYVMIKKIVLKNFKKEVADRLKNKLEI